VRVFGSLLESGAVTGGDGIHRLDADGDDRLSAPGRDIDYRLTAGGREQLEELGVALPGGRGDRTLALRYCVDWTEQRHHLSGVVGRALMARLLELGWLERERSTRAVRVVGAGERRLRDAFGAAVLE
jgi:hypothetical protein